MNILFLLKAKLKLILNCEGLESIIVETLVEGGKSHGGVNIFCSSESSPPGRHVNTLKTTHLGGAWVA